MGDEITPPSVAQLMLRAIGSLLVLASIGLIALSLGSLMFGRIWLADALTLFRPHLLGCGVFLFVVAVVLRGRATVVASAVALASTAIPFFALLPVAGGPVDGQPLRLMTANLYIENEDPASFIAYVRLENPDILITQETSPAWQTAMIDGLAFPFETSRDLRSRNDMKVWSRYPILSEQVVESPETHPGLYRHPMRLEIETPGGRLVLYALHPDTPRERWHWHQRNMYLELVADMLASEGPDVPLVLAGDWNTPPWSPYFHDIVGRFDLRATEARWWPLATRFSLRLGIVALGMPIDHIVVGSDVGVSAMRTGPKIGSNHVPVVADLTLPGT